MTPTSPPHDHPVSTFALDVYWAAGCSGDDAIARHVAQCARCRAYLATLGALQALGAPRARVEATPIAPPRARRPGLGSIVAGATAALAFAAGIGLFVKAGSDARGVVYVGVKGTPSVQLLVHHGSATAIWDGRSAVHAGDAIALRAACGGLSHVSVVAADAARGAWSRVSDGPCPAGDDVLPFTLVVDGTSSEERIAVVMSDARLADDALSRAAEDSARTAQVWVVRFVIPEERP
jgi:hypothetical protein